MTIAFTPGEPGGIGPDLAIIHAQKHVAKNLLVFADPDLLLKRAKILKLPLKIVESDKSLNNGELCVYPIKLSGYVEPGILNADNAQYVLNTLDKATNFCLTNQCEALVTGPIHKGILNTIDPTFTGHTEYLAALSNTDKTVMMLGHQRSSRSTCNHSLATLSGSSKYPNSAPGKNYSHYS